MSSSPVSFKITNAGFADIWNATDTGLNVTLTHIQLGSGNRVPDGTETALVSPQQLAPIATGLLVSPTQIRMAAIFTGATAFNVAEIGAWAGAPGSSGAVLVAYWSQASGYLAVKSANVDFVFAHDMTLGSAISPGTLTIAADTGQSSMLDMIANHVASPDPHVVYALKTGVQSQLYTAVTTGGSAPAYTGSVSPAITAYAAGQRFRIQFNAASTGAATLNLNGLGTKSMKIFTAAGALTDPVAIPAGFLTDAEYNGSVFVVMNPVIGLSPHGCQTFTANGTFIVPENVYNIYISSTAGGSGGAGGGCSSVQTGYYCGGGAGGGAGQWIIKQACSVTPLQSIPVIIGAGGVGGTTTAGANGGSGGAGGNTIIGSLITLTGAGAPQGGAGGINAGGGMPGTGYPGGSWGTDGFPANASTIQGIGNGGAGASGPFGGGGGSGRSGSLGSLGGASCPAYGYGSGGGGGATGITGVGSPGMPGIVIFEW